MQTEPATDEHWVSRFGTAPPFTVGVEEELLLVGQDLRPIGRGAEVIDETEPEAGDLGDELFKAMVESKSEISVNAAEALAALRQIRRNLIDAGTPIIGVGVHPDVRSGEAELVDSPRYEEIADHLRGIIRTPICGQHIHVGMPDAEPAVRAYNGIRTHIPLINALAANSPFWFGRDSGLASARTAIFRSYPRAAMAPAFADFAEFWRVTRQVVRAAGLTDYTQIWWDARIHPALGTVEIRAADTQFDLRRAAGLTALVHCLARVEAERDQAAIPAREALAESSFQATRHGLEAKLLDRDASLVPARELGRRTLELAATVADELDCAAELAEIETILEHGTGADLQRRAFAEGGMEGLLRFLAEETARLEG
jgi:glutamate---cysteine ligase / carboxylate-amine ligase